MNNGKVAVIMSVYFKDSPLWLRKSVASVFNQSYSNVALYLYVDGPVCAALDSEIASLSSEFGFCVHRSDKNIGLANAMNTLIKTYALYQHYQFIARMDADDINDIHRISKQVEYMEAFQEISVLGTNCIEIDDFDNHIGAKKVLITHDDIVSNIIQRCPVNHPTVLIRSKVFEDGNYYDPSLKNTQDYFFWVELISKGYKFANINEPLLYFRVTKDFFSKRGKSKAINDYKGRLYAMKLLNIVTVKNYCLAFCLLSLRLSPPWIIKYVYRYLR